MASKSLQARTEEHLLYCLSNSPWIDQALCTHVDWLLDQATQSTSPRTAEELEALARLWSMYYKYLPPRYCSKEYKATGEHKVQELVTIKSNLDFILEDLYPHVPFSSSLRVKSVQSYEEKVWRSESTPSKAEKTLKDLIAMQFILSGRTSDEFVNECYLFMEAVVDYLWKICGFRPLPGKPKDTQDFNAENFNPSIVYVPSPESIPTGLVYLPYAKNYIITPKGNGHQALQICLYSPQRGIYLDLHFKTEIMHDNSEHFESSHSLVYKAPGGTAHISSRLFDDYDMSLLNGLYGFRSRTGEPSPIQDRLGIIIPRFFY